MKSPQKFQGQLDPDDQMVFRNPSLPGILLLFLISHFFTKQPLFSWRPSEIQVVELASLDFNNFRKSLRREFHWLVLGYVAIPKPVTMGGGYVQCF